MAKVKGAVVVDVEKCKGCGVCIVDCPTDTLGFERKVNGKGYHFAYMKEPESCVGCAICAISCPDSVITVYKVRLERVKIA